MTQLNNLDVMTRIRDAASNLVEPPLHLLKGEYLRRQKERDAQVTTLERECAALEQAALVAATAILTRHKVHVITPAATYKQAVQTLLENKDEPK